MLEDGLSRVRKPAVFIDASIRITDMPIRFRCAYCNQLLGISRRKAGTAVRCPTCAGKVIVPNVEAPPANSDSSNPLVFERSDFDDLLNTEGDSAVPLEKKESAETAADSAVPLSSASSPPPGAWGTHPEPAFDVERINPGSLATAESVPQAGIFLSTRNAVLLAVAVAVLLGVFFVAGLLLGLWLRPAQDSGHGSRTWVTAQRERGKSFLAQAASS
jgi:DNA-directed RNA polymerase subunit RPC12/RpoP